MKTRRVLYLYKIKSNLVRRIVIIFTLPILVIGNLALWFIGAVVFAYKNQIDLFKSASHYWKTYKQIDESERS